MSDESSKRPPKVADTQTTAESPPRDLVLVGGQTDSGEGYRVLRQRNDRFEVGELRELAEGRPVNGELVKLHPTEEHERLYECEVLYDPAADKSTPPARKGPAQVTSDAYRRHWQRIFSPSSKPDGNKLN